VFRLILGAALICLTIGSAQAEESGFQVSTFALDSLPLNPPNASVAAQQLSADGWRPMTGVKSNTLWNARPTSVKSDRWVSVVTVGFHEQAEAYAFMFDGPQGAMSLAAHLPFRQTPVPGGTAWIWPADRIGGALQVAVEHSPESTPQPLKLSVVPWKKEPGETQPTGNSFTLNDARTLKPEEVLPGVEVIAHAAAFQAGWAPTQSAADIQALCEVRVHDQSCSFRLTFTGAKGKRTIEKKHASWDSYHEHLVRLFRFAAAGGVSDFAQLGEGEVTLLAIRDDRLACLVGRELSVFDLQTGKRLWTTEPTVKPPRYNPPHQYSVIDEETSPRLVRHRGAWQEYDWETGKAKAIDPPATSPSRYEFSSEQGESLAAVDPATGDPQWKTPLGDVLLLPPQPIGEQLLVATKGNQLLLLSATTGKIERQRQWPTWLVSVRVIGDRVACTDLAGDLTLLSLPDLQTQRIVKLGSEPVGPILYSPQLAHRWPTPVSASAKEDLLAEIKAGPSKSGPVLLITDRDGFVQIVPLAESP